MNPSPPSASRVKDLFLRVAFVDPQLQHDYISVLIDRNELRDRALLAAKRLIETDTIMLAPKGVRYSTTKPVELHPS